MDELIKELKEQAGMLDQQAKVAAAYIVELLKDEDRRKKVVIAATSATIGSAVVTGAI